MNNNTNQNYWNNKSISIQAKNLIKLIQWKSKKKILKLVTTIKMLKVKPQFNLLWENKRNLKLKQKMIFNHLN